MVAIEVDKVFSRRLTSSECIASLGDDPESGLEIFVSDPIPVSQYWAGTYTRGHEMKHLSNFIHEIENSFHRIREKIAPYDQKHCLELLDTIDQEMETYIDLARSKLRWDIQHASVHVALSDLADGTIISRN